MSDPVDYVRLTQLAAEATPGPWIVGDRWHVAGVMPEKFGDGRCAKCNSGNPVVWEGRRDINGTKMQAHVHQSPEPWYGDGHQIFAYDGGPSRVTIAGNYDYEEGGILSPADCEFIAAASPDVVTRLLADLEKFEVGLAGALGALDGANDFDLLPDGAQRARTLIREALGYGK